MLLFNLNDAISDGLSPGVGAVMTGMITIKTLVILQALLFLTACQACLPAVPEPPAGTYRVPTDITYNALHRTFLLHVPPDYHADTPLPLVVVIHGAFSTGKQTETETGFSGLADMEHFLVAYPEGIGLFGLWQHWNAGFCCGKAADDHIDDVGFIAETISTIRKKLAVDPARIYMAGMSNGGMLTYRYAAERTGDLAAAAVVSGAIGSDAGTGATPWRLPQPSRALPIMIVHGLADDTIPVTGGISPRKKDKRSFSSLTEAIEFWRTADGCQAPPVETVTNQGSAKYATWEKCRDGSVVESILLSGWGHEWPTLLFTERLKKNDPLRGFDAAKRIWVFFSRFRRSGPDN